MVRKQKNSTTKNLIKACEDKCRHAWVHLSWYRAYDRNKNALIFKSGGNFSEKWQTFRNSYIKKAFQETSVIISQEHSQQFWNIESDHPLNIISDAAVLEKTTVHGIKTDFLLAEDSKISINNGANELSIGNCALKTLEHSGEKGLSVSKSFIRDLQTSAHEITFDRNVSFTRFLAPFAEVISIKEASDMAGTVSPDFIMSDEPITRDGHYGIYLLDRKRYFVGEWSGNYREMLDNTEKGMEDERFDFYAKVSNQLSNAQLFEKLMMKQPS